MTNTALFRFVQLRGMQMLQAPTSPEAKEERRAALAASAAPVLVSDAETKRFYGALDDDLRRAPILTEAATVLDSAVRDAVPLGKLAEIAVGLRQTPDLPYDGLAEAFGLSLEGDDLRQVQRLVQALPKWLAAADVLGDRAQELARFAESLRGGYAVLGDMQRDAEITSRWPMPADLARAGVEMADAAGRIIAAPQAGAMQAPSLSRVAPPAAHLGADLKGRAHAVSIGDLYVVEETGTSYDFGDIAHVENVLKSEQREREFTLNRVDEVETYRESEETRRQENEHITDENQSFQTAINTTMRKSSALGIMTGVSGGFGPVSFSAGANFSTSNSKTTAKTAASNFSRSVMERAAEETSLRVLESRRRLSRTEVTDRSLNGFDNRQGPNHVVGIYRFLNKTVTAQTRNYGARLMLDFILPEPAALMVALAEEEAAQSGGVQRPLAFTDVVSDIDEGNYRDLAARYGVTTLSPPPPYELRLNKSFNAEPPDKSDFASPPAGEPDMDKQNPNFGYATGRVQFNDIPEGYYALAAKAALANIPRNYINMPGPNLPAEHFGTRLEVSVGHHVMQLGLVPDSNGPNGFSERNEASVTMLVNSGNGPRGLEGPVELGWACSSAYGVAVSVDLYLRRSPAAYAKWQLESWLAINEAYQSRLRDWENEQTLASVTGQSFGDNPALNRALERRELKAATLSALLESNFLGISAISTGAARLPVMDFDKAAKQARSITFFEEALDWDNLAFQLYDYSWAGRNRWKALMARRSRDPEHQNFLRAGAAKISLPVQPGAELAVLNFLAGLGIWQNGYRPETEDAFQAIYGDLAELGMVPGKEIDIEAQESGDVIASQSTMVPTNLVILQEGPHPNQSNWVSAIELPPPGG
ncbi:MAG: hypothetical protein OIF40_00015 [Mangrovicoccus sp.]|nr:hypothetical protein [Mangrovicoccus sp.]